MVKYTLAIFLEKSKTIYDDKIDYSQVEEHHINGINSRVPLICKKCQYDWSPTINTHIHDKRGCPNCTNNAPWTLKRFLIKAKELHGDNHDYSQVMECHIKNVKSRVPLICKKCQRNWSPTIQNYINRKSDCPDCYGIIRWTLETFLIKAKKIHGDKYDYSQVMKHHINGVDSRVPLICKKCQHGWSPSINVHINSKNGCPGCGGIIPWTLERFKEKAKNIHGDKVNYSQLTENDINGNESHIPLECNICLKKWSPSINSHINNKTGCPCCCFHNGHSQAALNWINFIEKSDNIIIQCATSIEGEFKIKSPNKGYYKVDGYCKETNTVYEYHGDYWHGNPDKYDSNDFNRNVKKTFGELYQKTINRENYIKSLGYILVVKWETPLKDKLRTYPKNIISVIEAYTDGSCKGNPGLGGWGWVCYEKGDLCDVEFSDYGGKNDTTNNNMELTAMAELLEFLSIGKSVNIYSDSRYVLDGIIGNVKELTLLTSPPQGWTSNKISVGVGYLHKVKKDPNVYNQSYWKIIPANDEIWWRIHRLLLKHLHGGSKLYFSWIKGHSGNYGNDRADELSNQYYKGNAPKKS